MSTPRRGRRLEAVDERESASPLELFFDLVFVFALTQVTEFMAEDASAVDVLRGVLVITVMWWCWIGYSWLCSLVRAEQGAMRIGLFAAMGAVFVQAITIPEAFDDLPGGLDGPVVVAVCYLVFRMLHLGLFYLLSGDDSGLRGQLLRFTPAVLAGTALLLVAAGTDGAAQTWLWAAALAADYGGTWLGGARGWRIRSARHFAERHGLIVIIALGESIVAIGVGVALLPISWPIVVASVLGLTLSGALWWAYFDMTALRAERAFAATPDDDRARFGRDAYTFVHLPLVAGVVLLALGLKKVLEYVGDTEAHGLADPLKGVALIALVGGVGLYLLASVAFAASAGAAVERVRLVVALLLLPLAWAGSALPALAMLGVLTGVMVALVAYESLRDAEARHRLRHEDGHAATSA